MKLDSESLQVLESLLVLESIIYDDVLSIELQHLFLFDEFPESESYDEDGEFSDEDIRKMKKRIDEFMDKNKKIIDKLLFKKIEL